MITENVVTATFVGAVVGAALAFFAMLKKWFLGCQVHEILRNKEDHFLENLELLKRHRDDPQLCEIVLNEILSRQLQLDQYQDLYQVLPAGRVEQDWDELTGRKLDALSPLNYHAVMNICSMSRPGCQSREEALSELLNQEHIDSGNAHDIFNLAATPRTRSKAIDVIIKKADNWFDVSRAIGWCSAKFADEERQEYLDRLYLRFIDFRQGRDDLLFVIAEATTESEAWLKAVELIAKESATSNRQILTPRASVDSM